MGKSREEAVVTIFNIVILAILGFTGVVVFWGTTTFVITRTLQFMGVL